MNPAEVVNERKLSIVQKYWHLFIIGILMFVIVVQYKENRAQDTKLINVLEERIKEGDQKTKNISDFNELSHRLEEQARTLNSLMNKFLSEK